MEHEMEYLLKLLRGFLWDEPVEAEENVDWKRLIQLAYSHSVVGILGYLSMRYPIAPESYSPLLRQSCLQTIGMYTRRGELAQELLQAMAQEGIDCCTMKGFVLRQLYPVPELRSFNDVDILIRREDRQRTHRLMLDRGLQVKDDWEPIYSYYQGEEHYELHTQLIEVDITDRADYQGFFDRVWDHTVETAPHCFEMKREFHLLYLICHIAKHVVGSGAGVRMYLDIAACLKAWGDSLDWGWIMEKLEELALTQFGCAVLTAAESWFDTSCKAAFDRLNGAALERFAQFTLEAGTFGHHGRDAALATLKKGEGSRLSLLIRRLFPSAKSLERRYTYLQKRPWLLPVAWVHRLFKTDGSVAKHAREARGILTHDPKEAQRLKEICKEIGL